MKFKEITCPSCEEVFYENSKMYLFCPHCGLMTKRKIPEEIWKGLVYYDSDRNFYDLSDTWRVSNLGRVRRKCGGKWEHRKNNNVTTRIASEGITIVLSRAIASTFLDPPLPTDEVVRHLDGNPRNNKVTNLSWGSAQDNINDKEVHGTTTKGENNPHSKVSNEEVIEIRNSYDLSIPLEVHALNWNISCLAMRRILNGESYTEAGGKRWVAFYKHNFNKRLNALEKHNLLQDLAEGYFKDEESRIMLYTRLAVKYKTSYGTCQNLHKKERIEIINRIEQLKLEAEGIKNPKSQG